MRKSVRNELRMARELIHHLLSGGHVRRDKKGHVVCFFTGKRLLENPSATFGHHNHLKLKLIEPVTVHHRDGDHDNNDPKNRTLALRSAHKSYHMSLQHKAGTMNRWSTKKAVR